MFYQKPPNISIFSVSKAFVCFYSYYERKYTIITESAFPVRVA